MNEEQGRKWIPAHFCERCQRVHEAHWEFRLEDAIKRGVETLREEIDRKVLEGLTR